MDQKSLPIGPEEAFVLSRVDGRTTETDIASATGLGDQSVRKVLDKLAELGAVRFQEVPLDTPTTVERRASPSGKLRRPVVESAELRHWDDVESAALYDPSEIDEPCDLDVPRKRAILDIFYRLDRLDHYEILDLQPGAEKKDVKAAYFKYVGLFHPDKYYGKHVGSFKPKLEQVFARLTEAHDTLTRKKTRKEYDEYLAAKRRNTALEKALYGERDHRVEIERAHQRIHETARMGERANWSTSRPAASRADAHDDHVVEPAQETSRRADPRSEPDSAPQEEARPSRPPERQVTHAPSPPVSTPVGVEPRRQTTSQTGPSSGISTTRPASIPSPNDADAERSSSPPPDPSRPRTSRPSAPPTSADARRRAFARRMGMGPASMPPPQRTSPSETKRQVADDLKRMYTTRVERARDSQVKGYIDSAEDALRNDNPVSAANALRVAASLAPDNEQILRRLAEVEQEANVRLADNYLDQAKYEEQEGHWEQAARSYQRAALGKPSARVHERVAHCLLKADGDMKVASDHGKKAVISAPNQASMRVTLAQVYLKAGMRQSAIAEFERAQALAPHDDTIKDWLKRIRRNQV